MASGSTCASSIHLPDVQSQLAARVIAFKQLVEKFGESKFNVQKFAYCPAGYLCSIAMLREQVNKYLCLLCIFFLF